MIRLSFVVPVVGLVLCCTAAIARAQADPEQDRIVTERAKSHLKSGFAYYGEANYDSAAHEMEAAYRLRPLPDLQYNLAQCYERLGRAKDAATAYRTYLAGKANAEDREEVTRRIANLEERAAREVAGAPPVPPPPVEKERIVLKEVVVYRDAPPKPGRGLRIAAFAVGGVAVAALAAGISFSVLAKRDSDAVSSGNPLAAVPFEGNPSQTQAAGQKDALLSYVSYGVAAAAAAGAVGLYLLGDSVDRDTAKLSLAPMVGPQGAGLAVAGRF